uniref:Uncharacterized protein n=1 Tax=Pyrodinium bahamense TaxID=73915 RepID=A0A7S0FCY1_9DINO
MAGGEKDLPQPLEGDLPRDGAAEVENGVDVGTAGDGKENGGWTVEAARWFLHALEQALSQEAFRDEVAKVRDETAAPARWKLSQGGEKQYLERDFGGLGRLFMSKCIALAEGCHIGQGQEGMQAALFAIWTLREDPETNAVAKAIEALITVPRGCIFIMDWVEEREQPEACELTVQTARDLVWKLIVAAESQDYQLALHASEVVWKGLPDAVEWAKPPLYHRFLLPVLREYGFHSTEPTAHAAAQATVASACAALQVFAYDAEVDGLSWRFERAAHWPLGSMLQVTPESTGGTKYRAINGEAYVMKVYHWETMRVDAAYEEDALAMVIPPEAPEPGPAPILLFLLGMGHFNSRQRFLLGDIPHLMQHEVIRKLFYVVVPKPDTRTGLAYWRGRRFEKDWNEDCVWSFLTEIMRRLGPEKVDNGRLYVTGTSQGGAGVWALCMKYGRHIAAAMPCGGACEWPGDTWPRGSQPKPEAIAELRKVPFRAIHVDSDTHAPPPKKDIEYLTYGLEERSCDIEAFGYNMIKKFDINIRKWKWEDPGDAWIEYWAVGGPLDDGYGTGYWARNDNHLIWFRQQVNWYWGYHSFFLENTCPIERRWKFDDPPLNVNTSEHKANLDKWGYFDIPKKDLQTLREEADVEKLVEAFRQQCLEAVQYARRGQEVQVTFHVGRAEEISSQEFRVVKDRPWDQAAVCHLKPHVNTILHLKLHAAEGMFEDIQLFDTFGVGFRPPPGPGTPPPIVPLPLDTVLTEEHANLDACEEKVPPQAPDAPEFTVWVLLRHHSDAAKDGFHLTTHAVKRGSTTVADMKKILLPMLLEKNLVEEKDDSAFDLCRATRCMEGIDNKIPGAVPLACSTMLTVEHQLLQVCKPGLQLELILDPVSGMKKDYCVELGSTAWMLRYMLADGKAEKAKRMGVGLPPKKKTEQPVLLEDDLVLTKEHSKLHLWTIVLPKQPKPSP